MVFKTTLIFLFGVSFYNVQCKITLQEVDIDSSSLQQSVEDNTCVGSVCYNVNSMKPFRYKSKDLKMKLMSYSRGCNAKEMHFLNTTNSCIDPSKDGLTLIIHGYGDNHLSLWVNDLIEAYLINFDSNVLFVDWRLGFFKTSYTDAISNAKMVANHMSRVVDHLIPIMKLSESDIHIIGHGMGVKIAGIIAKNISNVGHITALDPGYPFYEDDDIEFDKKYATYVQAIHTKIPNLGTTVDMATKKQIGHADFYIYNDDPHYCQNFIFDQMAISNIELLDKRTSSEMSMTFLKDYFKCTMGLAHWIYRMVLLENDCGFYGKEISTLDDYFNFVGGNLFEQINGYKRHNTCTENTCTKIGILESVPKRQGKFVIDNKPSHLLCPNYN